jgi:enolase-phosphatase E1
LPPPFDPLRIRALLLDIEGTTTPIDFVYRTLFPFASANVRGFLGRHHRDPGIRALLSELAAANREDRERGAPEWTGDGGEGALESAAEYVRWLIGRDSKITPLKSLEGRIWEEGFAGGQLEGQVYPDVAPAFGRWKSQGRRIAIFSSGSVLAQRLLFAHSAAGDLSPYLEAYFDTSHGPKREPESYRRIAAALSLNPAGMLFVSDVGAELDAARQAGFGTAHSLRPGIAPLERRDHPEIRGFEELFGA